MATLRFVVVLLGGIARTGRHMNIFGLIAIVMAVGAMGGLLNSVVSGELHLPHTDKKAKVWRPGWLGNMIAGGGAAFISWAGTGQLGGSDFFQVTSIELHFTVIQAASALLIGFGGGRFLTGESRRLILQYERDEEKQARSDTARAEAAARKKRKTHGSDSGKGT